MTDNDSSVLAAGFFFFLYGFYFVFEQFLTFCLYLSFLTFDDILSTDYLKKKFCVDVFS